MLLEALIAILIFSLGILGVVGMQASAIAASRDAKFRADAGLLANELLGNMWAANRDGPLLQTNFQGDGNQADATNVLVDGPNYAAWFQRVSATLPGVLANPPLVYVGSNPNCTPGPAGLLGNPGTPTVPRTSTPVCITVRWQAPNDTTPHSYRVFVQII